MPATAKKELSWEPVLHGPFYCSLACGGKCTRKANVAAVRGAAAMVRRMGPGWTPRVWENLGWHYEVISPCGRIKVIVTHHLAKNAKTYTAYLGEKGEPGGRWVDTSRTPEGAIKKVIEKAQRDLKRLGASLKGLPTVRG